MPTMEGKKGAVEFWLCSRAVSWNSGVGTWDGIPAGQTRHISQNAWYPSLTGSEEYLNFPSMLVNCIRKL